MLIGDKMEITIERLDHHGRGISYLNGKIVFVDNALPNEIVKVSITKETSKYSEAKVIEYIKKSNARVKNKCPFYLECGGCDLRHMSYEDTIRFKCNKIKEIINKFANIEINPIIIKNVNKDFYRNKLELKVKNGIIGFYKKGTHELVGIDRCLNAEEPINSFLLNIDDLHIHDGEVIVRSNYNGEIMLIIETEENPNIDIEHLREKNKLVGIILNGKVIFGVDHFIEIIDDMFFKMSFNSFFQINRTINKELFKIVEYNIDNDSVVLDLCSGVGTLSIVASTKASKVYGVEIVENAIKDSLINAKMNRRDNINFILGDAFKTIDKINDKIDTILIDPPRSGLNRESLESILTSDAKKIIYVSCDPVTLARDLKVLLSKYIIKSCYILDMFSYTYHVECVALLCLKDN